MRGYWPSLADEVYGADYKLRSLEERHHRYVLAVASNQYVWVGFYRQGGRADTGAIRGRVGQACGEGCQGCTTGRGRSTARWRVGEMGARDRRPRGSGVPPGVYPDRYIARGDGAGGTQVDYRGGDRAAKGGRSWRGWYRHITLSMLAHPRGYQGSCQRRGGKKGASHRQGASSLAEFKRRRGLLG